jgi:hypothetical protein
VDATPKKPRRPKPIFTPEEQAEREAARQVRQQERQLRQQARSKLPPELLEFERRANVVLNAMLPEINQILDQARKK